MARVPEDQSFNPCNPGYVKGYLLTAFMARGPDDHSFNFLPTRNILKVFDSTHS